MGSLPLGSTLRRIGRLFNDGSLSGCSDSQLLERFATRRDSDAFATLVERHGPMVLGVCRGVLKDANDAQDAFQATFLVLVRKADSLWVIKSSLGSWLYRVAYRIAVQANVDAARRRDLEKRAGAVRGANVSEESPMRDFLALLHEEIERLPEKFRAPFVLCHLEEMTHAEAADQLGWSVGTVRGRVAKARKLLQTRLTRRDLALSGGLLFSESAGKGALASVPQEWVGSTVGVATKLVTGQAVAGTVSATALVFSRRLLRNMAVTKLKWGIAVLLIAGMATGAVATFSPPAPDGPEEKPKNRPADLGIAVQSKKNTSGNHEPMTPISIAGRVLDPDGRPKSGATIFVRHHQFYGVGEAKLALESMAKTGPDGRFHFELDPSRSDASAGDRPSWQAALIVATAPGTGPTWIEAGDAARGEFDLRLAADHHPIRGRILDSQGRGVPQASLRVDRLALPVPGTNLKALLASGKVDWDGMKAVTIQRPDFSSPTWIGRDGVVTADAEGRFQIDGVGDDRVVLLSLETPGLERARVAVLARTSEKVPPVRSRPSQPDMLNQETELTLYGSAFDHVAGPSKPITGIVREKGTGRPVEGVTVAAQIVGRPWSNIMTSTDRAGRYLIDGLPKSPSYSLNVRTKPGGAYLGLPSMTVADTEGVKPIDVPVELSRGVAVKGRLVDKTTRRALACDWVHYLPLPSNPTKMNAFGMVSGKDRSFLITIAPGDGILAVKVAGKEHPYPAARLRPEDRGKITVQGEDGARFGFPLSQYHAYRLFHVREGTDATTIELEVAATVTHQGKVVGPDGQPVVGALALGLGTDQFTSLPLKGSTFEVQGLQPKESRSIEIRQDQLGLAGAVTLNGTESAKQPIVVRLEHCGAITGRLVDDGGIPLNAAEISALVATRVGYRPNEPAFWPRKAVTDAQGRFRIDGINPALEVRLFISDPNHPASKYETKPVKDLGNLSVKPGQVLGLGDITVRSQLLP